MDLILYVIIFLQHPKELFHQIVKTNHNLLLLPSWDKTLGLFVSQFAMLVHQDLNQRHFIPGGLMKF